jgi:5'-nucleotidase
MKVYYKDEKKFIQTVEKIRADGANKLQIVSDFDRTMTPAMVGSMHAPNSTSVMEASGLMQQGFAEYMDVAFRKYHPVELDPSMPLEEKLPIMEEWTRSSIGALVDYGFKFEHLAQIADSGLLRLRDGVDEFFQVAEEAGVSMVIFSAGLGDMIKVLCERQDLLSERVHVVSNMLDFDEAGNCTGLKGELVNILNKTEAVLVNSPYVDELLARPNVLLVGDGVRDVHMVDGLPHREVLKVGLLNHVTEYDLKRYLDIYDVVLAGDADFTQVTALLKNLLGQFNVKTMKVSRHSLNEVSADQTL